VRLSDKSGFVPNTGTSPGAGRTATTAPREGAEPVGEPIYSSASADVQPPVPISALPSTGRYPNEESTGIIELLVNEDGRVAYVRLVSHPSRVQPLMLLSAAKTWTFRPALRDGRPVKFRLRVNVPSTLP
jgi:outer membrane biosynthesis protein TonB